MFTGRALLRPGTTSTFMPREETINAWRTSAEGTRIWITELVGRIARLEAHSKCVTPVLGVCSWGGGREWVEVVEIGQYNDFNKLDTLNSQYHWWASTFNMCPGFHVSPCRQSNRSDKVANGTGTTAGKTIQIVSCYWLSTKYRKAYFALNRQERARTTTNKTTVTPLITQSWNSIIPVIVPLAGSWNPYWTHSGINSRAIYSYYHHQWYPSTSALLKGVERARGGLSDPVKRVKGR